MEYSKGRYYSTTILFYIDVDMSIAIDIGIEVDLGI